MLLEDLDRFKNDVLDTKEKKYGLANFEISV
jgi:hypothetical protein